VVGFVSWQEKHGQFDIAMEERLAQTADIALQLLEEQDAPGDPAPLQVACCMSHYYLYRRHLDRAKEYLRRAVRIAKRADVKGSIDELRGAFADDSRLPAGVLQDARNLAEERVGALCQLLFLDRSLLLVFGNDSILGDEIEKCIELLRVSLAT
jgi:hypothetical protein